RGDSPVVDLSRGAEHAARRNRARARERAHDDHYQLPRRAGCAALASRARGSSRRRAGGPSREAARASAARAIRGSHAPRAIRIGVVAETPRIETDRLVLRRWDVTGDLDPWAAVCAAPEVMRYVGCGRSGTRTACAQR